MASIVEIVNCIATDRNITSLGRDFEIDIGRLKLKKNTRPPRITFIPVEAPIVATDDIGGRIANDNNQIRQIMTRMQGFEVYCQGIDISQTEDLSHAVIAAAWRQFRGSVVFGSMNWITQEEDDSAYATDGELVILEMVVKVPVLNFQPTLAGNRAQIQNQLSVGFVSTSFWGREDWGAPALWEVPEVGC